MRIISLDPYTGSSKGPPVFGIQYQYCRGWEGEQAWPRGPAPHGRHKKRGWCQWHYLPPQRQRQGLTYCWSSIPTQDQRSLCPWGLLFYGQIHHPHQLHITQFMCYGWDNYDDEELLNMKDICEHLPWRLNKHENYHIHMTTIVPGKEGEEVRVVLKL